MNTMTLVIPPLRERVEEIEPLALRFLREANEANLGEVRGIEKKALDMLKRYRWPGNVRELRNAIERAVVIARTRGGTGLMPRRSSKSRCERSRIE
jgi:two-component system response regulator AtoC